MNYSNELNLGKILQHAPTHLIMRRSKSFPCYYRGQDVDILCVDIQAMMDHITPFLPNWTKFPISPAHVQLDHWKKGLDVKFDLYTRHISSTLTAEALETMEQWRDEEYTFNIPNPKIENILKCYEYLRNKKAKYINFAQYEHLLKPYEI